MFVNELISVAPDVAGNEKSKKWCFQFQKAVRGIVTKPSSPSAVGGHLKVLNFSGARLYDLHSGPQRVIRQKPCPRGRFAPMVIVPLEGALTVSQLGRTCTLERGQFGFMDSAAPLEMVFNSEFRHLYLHFPSSSFGQAIFHKLVGQTFRQPTEYDGVFLDLVKGLWENAATMQLADHGSVLNTLTSLCQLTTPFRDHTNDFVPCACVKEAMSYIEHNLSEDWLTPQTVAKAQGLSRVYLDELFGRHGLRVERWIAERRLLRAKENISLSGRSGSHGAKTILNIALDVGFKSQSRFSRSFSERFGASPKEYKRLLGVQASLEQAMH